MRFEAHVYAIITARRTVYIRASGIQHRRFFAILPRTLVPAVFAINDPMLLSVDDAQAAILQTIAPLSSETVALASALGRVLFAAVATDRDLPPFDNSSMDGFAVQAADVAMLPAVLPVVGVVPAGVAPTAPLQPGTALRIMTGAWVPLGCDLVVPFEDTDDRAPTSLRAEGRVQIFQAGAPGANIRRAGDEVHAHAEVVPAGTPIGAGAIGVLATVGASRVQVFRRPKVAVLSTGDELVEVDEQPGPGQIRNGNSYAQAAQVREAGGEVLQLAIARDTEAAVREQLEHGRAWGADVFVSSGGVSVGDYDVVKTVVQELGTLDLWRVRMKPGKPLAFGHLWGTPFLGLPGNTVSAMITFELFARPLLRKLGGFQTLHRPTIQTRLATAVQRADRRQFVRVQLQYAAGAWTATLTGNQGSRMFSSMLRADGLAVIPEGDGLVAAGDLVDVLLLRWPEP